ncbi:MAG: hypothetical protein EPO24_04200 [Bacteroidetes bacterium]|nr:MAG: hypothetical protein EPO24_04200 [Bacteroidota bacterium]
MQDVMIFFAKTIASFSKDSSYFHEPLEVIASENGRFSYIDDRKNYSKKLVTEIITKVSSDEFIKNIVISNRPSNLRQIVQLFPKDYQNLNWNEIQNKVNSSIHTKQTLLVQNVRKNFVKILKGKDHKVRDNVLSSLLGFTFLSKSDNFPDFMFSVSAENNKLQNGSLFELKDSKGSTISSFNSTIPTQWKSLEEITKLNGSDMVAKLAKAIDFPYSHQHDYNTFKRKCFYFVRTNARSDNLRLSVVEGSFFETLPKERLIGETIKAIARDHFGVALTPELEQTFEKINDQSLIAKSRSDLRSNINGIEKRASVSPRFRIMSEVTSDGNPHLYPQIPAKTFNLIVQVSQTREKGELYIKQKESLVSMMTDCLSYVVDAPVIYDKNNNSLKTGSIRVVIKEIPHNRNGLHLVFQYDFGEKN